METSVLLKKPSNLVIRVLTSLIAGTIVMLALFLGSSSFIFLGTVVLLGLLWEWFTLTQNQSTPQSRLPLQIAGAVYITLSVICLIALSMTFSTHFVTWILGIVWTTDIAAYFCGSWLQGPKFAPKISPNKTWSGFLGGCLFGTLVGVLLSYILVLPPLGLTLIVIISLLFTITAHLGDLFESAVKRHLGVKDTSSLLPGHGGLLDRLDSLLAVSLVAYVLFIWLLF